ncbi:MAG TPA: 4-alpha-glucanotransferase [Gaiellaceae bacterium]|nr:4-alpha-glucanotransferase [Gaiellaceae bacterium]
MLLERSSGILLHPASLPNGNLDKHAYSFVDWLAAAGQRWWQVLPLGPPDDTGSPYMSGSAFAGSTRLLAEPRARVSRAELTAFREQHAYWLDDWVEFGGSAEDQVRFEREWQRLRAYAARRNVRIFGDMPIYVASSGADHRAHPQLFQRGSVAGVPPDYFTKTGQLWRNPLYDWRAMHDDGYRWWIARFRRAFELVDLTRVDHFRGFVAYWSVPERHKTAAHGHWRRGPGRKLFDAVQAELGPLPVVAENLGVITPPVERLRHELGYPGMVVLQFTLGRNECETRSVMYTGTHDNDTSAGWFASLSSSEQEESRLDPTDPAWSLIERAWSSRAVLAIAPLQDVLGLGSDARMNFPGTETGNWQWRYRAADLTAAHATRLRELSRASRRTK